MRPDLPERIEEIAETVSDWEQPLCARNNLRAAADELRRLRSAIKAMEERFGHFAKMRSLFPNEEASPAVLLAELAGMVHEAAAAGGEE